MSIVGHIVFYYIPSAWASALLILYQGQCESLMSGISKVTDSRALFYIPYKKIIVHYEPIT